MGLFFYILNTRNPYSLGFLKNSLRVTPVIFTPDSGIICVAVLVGYSFYHLVKQVFFNKNCVTKEDYNDATEVLKQTEPHISEYNEFLIETSAIIEEPRLETMAEFLNVIGSQLRMVHSLTYHKFKSVTEYCDFIQQELGVFTTEMIIFVENIISLLEIIIANLIALMVELINDPQIVNQSVIVIKERFSIILKPMDNIKILYDSQIAELLNKYTTNPYYFLDYFSLVNVTTFFACFTSICFFWKYFPFIISFIKGK